MNRTQWQLWFSDFQTEIKEWSNKSLLVWGACLLGSILFVLFAFSARNHAQAVFDSTLNLAPSQSQRLSGDASSVQAVNTNDSAQIEEPQQLVIVDAPAQPNDQNLKSLSETALTLHSRLQSGTESEASYASRAGRVAGLAVAMRQSQLANSEASFWRPISESIASLEQGVRLGNIVDGSSIGFITELRARYVDLRTDATNANDVLVNKQAPEQLDAAGSSATSPLNSTESPAATTPTATPASLAESQSLKALSLPLSLRLLPWLSLLLPLACLLFGVHALLARMQERHEAYPRKGYEKVAGAQQAQAMTATAAPENRHAAERKTQAAILQLLDEMEPLSEGDLTHEASVTEDLTGALADSFNHAVHELRRLVKQINRSTIMVRTAVAESRERTLFMARQGAVQAREVSRTNDRIEGMQIDVVSLSQTTEQVAEYAHKVARRTQQAAKSVTDTRDALKVMRARADVAERSMNRLVDSTKGIESRLADIRTAAKRTELLALNTTIQAASQPVTSVELAMDSTGAMSSSSETFSELATDVSSLAGQLTRATNDIDQLSVVIQDEAGDSLKAVNDTVVQLKSCEALSQQAKQHLDEIAQAAQALGDAVSDISQRSALQAQGVTEIANTTQVINNITHDTAKALTQAVQDLQNLENMSNSLEASVHGFRLPEELKS